MRSFLALALVLCAAGMVGAQQPPQRCGFLGIAWGHGQQGPDPQTAALLGRISAQNDAILQGQHDLSALMLLQRQQQATPIPVTPPAPPTVIVVPVPSPGLLPATPPIHTLPATPPAGTLPGTPPIQILLPTPPVQELPGTPPIQVLPGTPPGPMLPATPPTPLSYQTYTVYQGGKAVGTYRVQVPQVTESRRPGPVPAPPVRVQPAVWTPVFQPKR